jgi:hypothetical protein
VITVPRGPAEGSVAAWAARFGFQRAASGREYAPRRARRPRRVGGLAESGGIWRPGRSNPTVWGWYVIARRTMYVAVHSVGRFRYGRSTRGNETVLEPKSRATKERHLFESRSLGKRYRLRTVRVSFPERTTLSSKRRPRGPWAPLLRNRTLPAVPGRFAAALLPRGGVTDRPTEMPSAAAGRKQSAPGRRIPG